MNRTMYIIFITWNRGIPKHLTAKTLQSTLYFTTAYLQTSESVSFANRFLIGWWNCTAASCRRETQGGVVNSKTIESRLVSLTPLTTVIPTVKMVYTAFLLFAENLARGRHRHAHVHALKRPVIQCLHQVRIGLPHCFGGGSVLCNKLLWCCVR